MYTMYKKIDTLSFFNTQNHQYPGGRGEEGREGGRERERERERETERERERDRETD